MALIIKAFPYVLFVFVTFAVLNPNPFGNNPDIIFDESYFLTSALSAIKDGLPPGLDFPASGSYYGGIQAYIDTAAMMVVSGAVFAREHFSFVATKLWVALNTGELLHILRLVNGIVALTTLAFCYLLFKKRKIPPALALTLMLFLLLLLGNSVLVGFLHTAKMWVFYILIVAVMSALFIANEFYLSKLNQPLLSRRTYAALFIWSSVLIFFQSYVGVFSIFLLLLYALLLKHLNVRDVWVQAKKYWYFIVLFALTQLSFLYQAYTIYSSFSNVSIKTAQGAIDWFARLYNPLVFTVESQPLVMLYVLGALVLIFFAFYNKVFFADSRKRTYIAIALAHPILVYVIFHVILGFSLDARYAILLTIACSFSAAILMGEIGNTAVVTALTLSGILFVIVNVHAIALYWHPSSEKILLETITEKYNSPSNVFLVDHSARRLTLPVNEQSLLLLNEKRQDMARFQFILQHKDQVHVSDTFKPLTAIAYADVELADYTARFNDNSHSVWVVSRDCARRCTNKETQASTCFEINVNACGVIPQEPNTLPKFLRATQLGYSYIVRKVH